LPSADLSNTLQIEMDIAIPGPVGGRYNVIVATNAI